jgi:hypothetical protein
MNTAKPLAAHLLVSCRCYPADSLSFDDVSSALFFPIPHRDHYCKVTKRYQERRTKHNAEVTDKIVEPAQQFEPDVMLPMLNVSNPTTLNYQIRI